MGKTYISQITDNINAVTADSGPILLYGENINFGSCISGLARGLKAGASGVVLNVGNCELTHVGVGFGIMADGGTAALFVKQLDFMLLAIDQIVNTYNFFRASSFPSDLGSFTIYAIVCDHGFQGPQSSFNGAGDFASLANIEVFCLNAVADVEYVVSQQFARSGFRVICVSQRCFSKPALELNCSTVAGDLSAFRYAEGHNLTIVCFNFSLREGVALADRLGSRGLTSDVFHVNYIPSMDYASISESLLRTGNLIVLDDSKSVVKFSDKMVAKFVSDGIKFRYFPLIRPRCESRDYGIVRDEVHFDVEALIARLDQ